MAVVAGGASRSVVVLTLVVSLVAYAALAATRHWWLSAIAAPVVAILLWRRHPRARFTAYVLFTVLAVRGGAAGDWVLVAYAALAVALMQMPAARRAWPRLVPGRLRGADDRMRRS